MKQLEIFMYTIEYEFETTVKRDDQMQWVSQPAFIQAEARVLPRCDCGGDMHEHVQDVLIKEVHVTGKDGEEYPITPATGEFEDEAVEAAYAELERE